MNILKFLRKNIDVILLSLVVCMNSIRVMLGLGETTIILYGLYLLCVAALFIKYGKKFSHMVVENKIVKTFFILIILMVLYAMVSQAWIQSSDVFSTYLKFLLSMSIGVVTVAMPLEKIKLTLNYIIIINVVYSLLLLLMPRLASVSMENGLNYLNATLPLGTALTITLIRSLNAVSNKGGVVISVVWIVCSALFFAALVGFVARGVLLFPPLIAALTFLFMEKEHKFVAWLLLPLFFVVLYFFYEYYMSNATDYAASRMMNLIESSEGEDRWRLWSKSINEMFDKIWFVFGGGIDAFRYNSSIHYYPHNIFIQIIGEYGLVGIIISILTLWYVIKGFIQSRSLANQMRESDVLYCTIGVFAYYTLTFSKSFSLYDGLPLFVSIAFCLSLYDQLRRARKWTISLSSQYN